jgi:hypothetical protein
MTAEIERLPHIYPPRHREFAYVIVAEPDSFVLCKVYTNNIGTVRLAEFKTRKEADSFVNDLASSQAGVAMSEHEQELRRLAPRLALGAGMDRCSGPLEITHGRVLKGRFNSLPSAL